MDLISGFWKVGATKAKEMLSQKEVSKENLIAAEKTEEGASSLPGAEGETTKPASSLSLETQQGNSDREASSESEGPDSVRSTSPISAEDVSPKEAVKEADTRFKQSISSGPDIKDVSHKAVKSAKSIGSFLYGIANKTGRTISQTAKQLKHTVEENSILGDFNKEQEAFVNSKAPKSKEGGVAPWVGSEDEENVKQQILSLSADKRNFLRSPPTGVQFEFNFDSMYPTAMVMLQEDPELEKMRFELVPKLISEENFWRNYFYRVSLLKQSTRLSSLSHQKSSSGESSSWSSRKSSSDESVKAAKQQSQEDVEADGHDSPSQEFVSDAYQGSSISEEDIKQGMKLLGVAEKGNKEEEWEKELQKELQEYEVVAEENAEEDPEWENEIEQMLGDEKLKDVV